VAWRLLEKWAWRDQATIVRHKVYTFRSLLAEKWLELIAGSAADAPGVQLRGIHQRLDARPTPVPLFRHLL
jgi:hypothetical protein